MMSEIHTRAGQNGATSNRLTHYFQNLSRTPRSRAIGGKAYRCSLGHVCIMACNPSGPGCVRDNHNGQWVISRDANKTTSTGRNLSHIDFTTSGWSLHSPGLNPCLDRTSAPDSGPWGHIFLWETTVSLWTTGGSGAPGCIEGVTSDLSDGSNTKLLTYCLLVVGYGDRWDLGESSSEPRRPLAFQGNVCAMRNVRPATDLSMTAPQPVREEQREEQIIWPPSPAGSELPVPSPDPALGALNSRPPHRTSGGGKRTAVCTPFLLYAGPMEIYSEGIAKRLYNLLREPASRGWPRVLYQYRLRSPEASYRQKKIEKDFLCAETIAAKPWGGNCSVHSPEIDVARSILDIGIPTSISWGFRGGNNLDRSTPWGATLRGPARARTSFPKAFSPEGRSLNRPSAQRALGESVASVAKIPKERL